MRIFGLPFEENRGRILNQMNFSAAYVNLPWRLKIWESLYTFARLYQVADFTRRFVVQKSRQAKMSLLFTSHNMAEIQEVCDRVIFLDHGRIIAEDTPEGLAAKW